ncbi:MAG: hypothetical protein CL568_00925 [Alphaproteobacteria bacterium]|jgi:uncharacterized membrane protein|nr:hypothetical protein [Alphaproteobacteria bacterium]PPR13565.1 MAG: hypothetical protein CFH42_01317 [Alphaproteobacteria bacterium MarineAlpha12_Bin1]|tara:strand:+ start:9611 stop:9826 length:216 start_codon:yes stop_codon:yes gene_type:complete
METKKRSLLKTITWRSFVFLYWAVFGYIATGSVTNAGIFGLGSIIPSFFYYVHERFWNKISWGREPDTLNP